MAAETIGVKREEENNNTVLKVPQFQIFFTILFIYNFALGFKSCTIVK